MKLNYQHFAGKYWSKCIFEWKSDGISSSDDAHDISVSRIVEKFYKNNEYGYFSECNDAEQLDIESSKALKNKNIRSFIHCGIMDKGKFMGCIGFDDCYEARYWTKTEHEVLKAFADIMGSFLLDQTTHGNQHFSMILDSMERYIWVIDANTHQILYMNTPAYSFFGKDEPTLQNCYKTFTSKNKICEDCPLKKDIVNKQSFNIWNSKFHCYIHGGLFPIQWDEGANAILFVVDTDMANNT